MDSYKHLGLVAVLSVIVGLLFLVLRWPQGIDKTFSQHAAAYRHTILYYIGLFTLVLPPLLLFFIGWFVPHFGLPVWFAVAVTASALLQYSVTLIPEVGGWRTRYHRALTFLSVLLLLPALGLVVLASSVSAPSKLIVGLGIFAMVAIMAIVAINKSQLKQLLFLQAGYYAAFFVAILFTTYVG